MVAVGVFFQGLVTVVMGLLVPEAGAITPLQTLMWAGLILTFIPFVVSLIKRLASSGG